MSRLLIVENPQDYEIFKKAYSEPVLKDCIWITEHAALEEKGRKEGFRFLNELELVNVKELLEINEKAFEFSLNWYQPVKDDMTEEGICFPQLMEREMAYYFVRCFRLLHFLDAAITRIQPKIIAAVQKPVKEITGARWHSEEYAFSELAGIAAQTHGITFESLPGCKERKNIRIPIKWITVPKVLLSWSARFLPRMNCSRRKALFSGNPKLLFPAMKAAREAGMRPVYFDQYLPTSWRKGFEEAGIEIQNFYALLDWKILRNSLRLSRKSKRRWQDLQNHPCWQEIFIYQRYNFAKIAKRRVSFLLNHHFPRLAPMIYVMKKLFQKIQPDWLLVDEDIGDEKKALVLTAKQNLVPSAVAMHGGPAKKVGFVPLTANFMIVWGEAFRTRFVNWDVEPDRVFVAGSSHHGKATIAPPQELAKLRESLGLPANAKVGMLALDFYYDFISGSFYGGSFSKEEMRTIIQDAIEAFHAIENAYLIVKAHPRDPNMATIEEWVRAFSKGRAVFVGRSDIMKLIQISDLLCSTGSTAIFDGFSLRRPCIVLDWQNASFYDFLDPAIFPRASNRQELKQKAERIFKEGKKILDQEYEYYFAQFPEGSDRRIVNFLNQASTPCPVSVPS